MFARAARLVQQAAALPKRPLLDLANKQHGHLRNSKFLCYEAQRPLVFDVATTEEFEEHVLRSTIPVIVDFHADWCGPCKMLGPRLEQKVQGREGAVLMAKVNIDEAGDLADEFRVSAVPTVIGFQNGEVVAEFQGMIDDDQIDEFLDQVADVPAAEQ
ncbi:unnamed protein product, partial [Mesorhabditis spiculigera]